MLQDEPPLTEESKFKAIPDHLKEYIQTKVNYYKLTAYEAAAKTASISVWGVALAIFGLFFLMFLSFAMAILLGDVMDNVFLGFLTVAGVYLLFVVLLIVMGDKIKTPIVNTVIKSLADNKNGRDEQNN